MPQAYKYKTKGQTQYNYIPSKEQLYDRLHMPNFGPDYDINLMKDKKFFINDRYYNYNKDLINQVYGGASNFALTYAKSSFQKMEPPAKETFKEKQERKKQEKLAKKENIYADHYSYGIMQSLQEKKSSLQDTVNYSKNFLKNKAKAQLTYKELENLEKLENDQNINFETLKCYCQGREKIAKNDSSNDQKSAEYSKDIKFFEEYLSDERRTAQDGPLYIITQDLLTTEISTDIFSYPYLKKHAGDVKTLCEKYTNFKRLYEAPENTAYFQSIPSTTKALIKTRILDMIEPLNNAFKAVLRYKAVDAAEQRYLSVNSIQDDLFIKDNIPSLELTVLSKALQNMDSETEEHFNFKSQLENTEGVKEEDIPGYRELEKCKKLISDEPNIYVKNKKLINDLYHNLVLDVEAMAHLKYKRNQYGSYYRTAQKMKNNSYWGSTAIIEGTLAYNEVKRLKAKNEFETSLYEAEVDAIANILEHLYKKTKLTPEGKHLLENHGKFMKSFYSSYL